MSRINELSTTSPTERRELLKWFAGMNDDERLDVLSLQRDTIRRWRNEHQKITPEILLAALAWALARRKATTKTLERRPQHEESDRASRLFRMRLDALAPERGEGDKTRQYRLRYHSLVCTLRKEGLGWRRCAEYLSKHHRFKISHEHLKNLHARLASRCEDEDVQDIP